MKVVVMVVAVGGCNKYLLILNNWHILILINILNQYKINMFFTLKRNESLFKLIIVDNIYVLF